EDDEEEIDLEVEDDEEEIDLDESEDDEEEIDLDESEDDEEEIDLDESEDDEEEIDLEVEDDEEEIDFDESEEDKSINMTVTANNEIELDEESEEDDEVELDEKSEEGDKIELDEKSEEGDKIELDEKSKESDEIELDAESEEGNEIELDAKSEEGNEIELEGEYENGNKAKLDEEGEKRKIRKKSSTLISALALKRKKSFGKRKSKWYHYLNPIFIIKAVNPFKTSLIFQVNYKIRIYAFLATIAMVYNLTFFLIPVSGYENELNEYTEAILLHLDKDILLNKTLTRIENKLPALSKKANQLEQNIINNTIKLNTGTSKKPLTSVTTKVINQLSKSLPSIREFIKSLPDNYQLKIRGLIKYLLVYIVFDLLCHLIFGVSFSLFLAGVRTHGKLLFSRIKAVFRSIFGIITLPLFIMTDLPLLFEKRSIKETLSFSSLVYKNRTLKLLAICLLFPLIIIGGFTLPIVRNIDFAGHIHYGKETKSIAIQLKKRKDKNNKKYTHTEIERSQILTPQSLTSKISGIKLKEISLPDNIIITPLITKKQNSFNPGLQFYDVERNGKVDLTLETTISFDEYVKAAITGNPLFPIIFPHLNKAISENIKNVKWNVVLEEELLSLFRATFSLNMNCTSTDAFADDPLAPPIALFKYLAKYGPFIAGYVKARNLLSDQLEIKKPTWFSVIRLGGNNYMQLKSNDDGVSIIPITSLLNRKIGIYYNTKSEYLYKIIQKKILQKAQWGTHKKIDDFNAPVYNAADTLHYLISLLSGQPTARNDMLTMDYFRELVKYSNIIGDGKMIHTMEKNFREIAVWLKHAATKNTAHSNQIIKLSDDIKDIANSLEEIKFCKKEMKCFSEAVTKCNKARVDFSYELDSENMHISNNTRLALLGKKDENCIITIEYKDVQTKFTPDAIKTFSLQNNKTEIKTMLEKSGKPHMAKIGTIHHCPIQHEKLIMMIESWKNGLVDEKDLQNCTITKLEKKIKH
ncbi:MAG: hypothetical protein KAQ98_13985, partial [Bacteriovoracaceae bacterium]|nr:hypothetical protein [Bacteriovoracaceae bacterium]